MGSVYDCHSTSGATKHSTSLSWDMTYTLLAPIKDFVQATALHSRKCLGQCPLIPTPRKKQKQKMGLPNTVTSKQGCHKIKNPIMRQGHSYIERIEDATSNVQL